jgi:hypothetical protein
MDPTNQLVDEIFRERVLRARATPPAEKLLDGPRLFDYACRITKAGIRHQHPSATDREIDQILADRIALKRRLEGRT